MWLVVAALCSYALGYRFYSKFVAAKVLALDAMRATPAERLENGRDFVRTNKWVVFGHHFAAIAGPGPLVRTGAGRAIRLPPGNAVDPGWSGLCRMRAGFCDSALLRTARRQITGPDGA